MAIEKRKSQATGKVYYYNTKTKKIASADSYHRSASAKSAKSPKSKATTPACSRAGYGVKVLRSGSAGAKLAKCGK
jgi:hypothetical protein